MSDCRVYQSSNFIFISLLFNILAIFRVEVIGNLCRGIVEFFAGCLPVISTKRSAWRDLSTSLEMTITTIVMTITRPRRQLGNDRTNQKTKD